MAPAPEDRPYRRPERDAFTRNALLVIAGCAAAGGIAWVFLGRLETQPPAPPPEPPAAAAPATKAAAPNEAQPAILHPLPPPAEAASLPTLAESDTLLRRMLVALIGREAFEALVYPSGIVRRIVATVDNLPRRSAPRRTLAAMPVPGAFRVAGQGDESTIAAENAARYAPYVRALQAVDASALVAAYVRAYPLFQQAYQELGFPGRYFNDRLIEAMDDLLAAPEPAGPVKLTRPKVLYEFADPALDAASAGQKILIRMGRDNALQVKAKLRDIRAALVAAGVPRS